MFRGWGLGALRARRRAAERERLFARFARGAPARVEARVRGQLGELPPRAGLEARLFELWIAATHERLEARAPNLGEYLRAAIELVQQQVVTQRQVEIEVLDSQEDDDFLGRKMTILASGLGNCEISNYLVWALLRARGVCVHQFETGLHEEFGGSHLLLYLVSSGGGMFVDAWSDASCFHLEGFVPDMRTAQDRQLAARHGSIRPPGVPTHAELAAHMQLHPHGLYPARALTHGIIREPEPEPEARVRSEAGRDAGEGPIVGAVWRDYVDLRLRHLCGELEATGEAYRSFAAREDVGGRLRELVEALARRQP